MKRGMKLLLLAIEERPNAEGIFGWWEGKKTIFVIFVEVEGDVLAESKL